MSNPPKKHPLIVYSGGIDSTALLYRELQKGDVYTCYIHGAQSPPKVPLELTGREKNIALFEKMTGNKVLGDTIVKATVSWETRRNGMNIDNGNLPPDLTWGQAFQWLNGILYVSDSRIHSEVMMGAVINDDIGSKLHNQQVAWEQIQTFTKHNPVPLTFPFYLTSKLHLVGKLPAEAFANIWTCELPKEYRYPGSIRNVDEWRPCGKCSACITFMQIDLEHQIRHGNTIREMVETKLREKAFLEELKVETKAAIALDLEQCNKEVTSAPNGVENGRETGSLVDLTMDGSVVSGGIYSPLVISPRASSRTQ